MERIGLSPGAEIGGYTILAPLGSGGMGTVYRAVDGGGTAVALKLLHPHIGADPSSRERLRREVLALQRLRHPGVAAVLDAEADSTEAFLVTELVPGHDLAEHVRVRGPLDAAALHRLAAGLRGALEAVHAAGVVHRDLKPSNVLVTADGPVLIDFGIAQAVDETRVTSAGFVVGTPGYLAPELIDGAEPTPATDWWGWAALLAHAATGRAPFGTRPLEAVLVRTRSGEADLAGLGPVTAGALWDALAADPADRAEPDEVVEALAEAERRGERYSPEAATRTLTAGAALAGGAGAQAATRAGGTVAFGAGDATSTLAHPAATGPVPPGMVAGAGTGATQVLGADGTALSGADGTALPGADGTALSGADGTAVLAPPPTSAQDGSTRAFLPPSVAPAGGSYGGHGDTPTQVWDARDADGDAWDVGEDDAPGDAGPGVPTPERPRRTGTVLALAVLVVAAAALYPGIVLLALVPLVLLARTVGSVSEALARRRERVGARRSDGVRAVASSPWHLVRALVTLLPSLLVAASVVVITLGAGWWLVGSGAIDAGPLRAEGDEPTPIAAAVLLAVATTGGLAALWWGPLAGTTRTGARRVLAAVAPGRGRATTAVLLALVGAAVLVALAATGSPVDWTPFAEPSLPTGT
jgi:hypothetical protein